MSSAIQFDVASVQVDQSVCESGRCICTINSIQRADFSINWPRQDILGWDGVGSQEQIVRPRADLSFSYIYDGTNANEHFIGLAPSPSGQRTPALSGMGQERNYYVSANLDNIDEIGYAGQNRRIFALGNGLVTHYDFSARIGQPSISNVVVEGLNLLIQPSGTGQPLPSVDKQAGTGHTETYTLPISTQGIDEFFGAAPSAIVMTFDTGSAFGAILSGNAACAVQSFAFSVDLPRVETRALGWAYPEQRPVQWPVSLAINADVILNGVQTDAINRLDCPDSGHSFTIAFRRGCDVSHYFEYRFEGARLNREGISLNVGGGPATTSLSWTLQLNDINRTGAGSPGFYIYTSLDPETVRWYNRVICAGGYFESDSIDIANNLILAIKASSFDAKIKYLLPFLGRKAGAARAPLRDYYDVGIADNFGFVDADFSQISGLQGNGQKFMDTTLRPSQVGQNGNGGMGLWVLTPASNVHPWMMGSRYEFGDQVIYGVTSYSSDELFYWGAADSATRTNSPGTASHYYGQRVSATDRKLYRDGIEIAADNTDMDAESISVTSICVMGIDGAFPGDGRIGAAYVTDGTMTEQEISDFHTLLQSYLITPTLR